MTIKHFITAMIFVGLVTGFSFARGTWDADPGDYGPYGKFNPYERWDFYEHGGFYGNFQEESGIAETYTGTFALEEEQYPTLETTDGQRYWLLPGAPIVGNLPQVGDELEIEAFPSSATPNTLLVVAARVNGVSITPELSEYGYYDDLDRYGGYYGRGPGSWGGGMGGPGGYGRGYGGYGGRGNWRDRYDYGRGGYRKY